jgi:hypothetical protein
MLERRSSGAGEFAVHQDDAFVALLHVGQEFLHHPRLGRHAGEQIVERAEVEIVLCQQKHCLAALSVKRLHDNVAVLGTEGLDGFEVAGNQRRRHQVGKLGDEYFLRRVAHMGRVIDHQGLRLHALKHVRGRDIGKIERRVLAQQHHVE